MAAYGALSFGPVKYAALKRKLWFAEARVNFGYSNAQACVARPLSGCTGGEGDQL